MSGPGWWPFSLPPSGHRPEPAATTRRVDWKISVDAQVSEGLVKVRLADRAADGPACTFRMTHDQTQDFVNQLLTAASAVKGKR